MDYTAGLRKPLIDLDAMAKQPVVAEATDDCGLNLVDAEKHELIHKINHEGKFGKKFDDVLLIFCLAGIHRAIKCPLAG